jgi:hypothetical protein
MDSGDGSPWLANSGLPVDGASPFDRVLSDLNGLESFVLKDME